MQRTLLVTAVLTSGMVFSLSPAAADPIRITGSVVVDAHKDAIIDVQGPQGFQAQFRNEFLAVGGPWAFFPIPQPGTLIPADAFIESADGAGTAEFRGVSYILGSTNAGPGAAVVHIRPIGPAVTVPPVVGAGATLKTSFVLSPSSNLELPGEPGNVPVPLTGRGTMTLEMVPNVSVPLWELAGIRYDFAPTPEPGTLTLLATAFGVLVLRRHRRSNT